MQARRKQRQRCCRLNESALRQCNVRQWPRSLASTTCVHNWLSHHAGAHSLQTNSCRCHNTRGATSCCQSSMLLLYSTFGLTSLSTSRTVLSNEHRLPQRKTTRLCGCVTNVPLDRRRQGTPSHSLLQTHWAMTPLAWLSENRRGALASVRGSPKQKQVEYLPAHTSQMATQHAYTFPLTRVASHSHGAEGHEGMHGKQDWRGSQQLWHPSIVVAMRHITWPGAFPRLW
ncbi:hypothetical protein TRVL_09946 [Trypanosoma vivax]|nr:hypothetical protein TRVL_09946 [Trypanosoma vivax]